MPAVLPYAMNNGLILLASDVSDFSGVSPSDREGMTLLHDQRRSAYAVANAVLERSKRTALATSSHKKCSTTGYSPTTTC